MKKNEKAPYQIMKKEVLERIIKLGLDLQIYESFCFENKLLCSDNGEITKVPKNILDEIKAWQKQYGNIVYHVIHSNYAYNTYECLSVSCYQEDWEFEREIMQDDWVMSHSINITIPTFTESGSIKIANEKGILKRIG